MSITETVCKVVIILKIIMCEDNIEYAKENLRIVKSFLEEKDIDCTMKHFTKYEDVLNILAIIVNRPPKPQKSLLTINEWSFIIEV
jgi:hypothetical protein